MSAAGTAAGLAIYLHWPFCLAKCPYCDFNSHVRPEIVEADWRGALVAEIDRAAADPAFDLADRRVTSVFFGGGTPSLMAPETVAALLGALKRNWRFQEGAEITLEANPTSVEAERFRGYRAAGVNRVSLGVQALDENDLRFLGRRHSRDEALRAVELARAIFPRISFDLIYARPGQSVASWRRELERALAFAADHLSVYQLTIEPGTAFFERAQRGEFSPPDEAMQARLYEATQATLAAAGMPSYEISNYARPGSESRHNLAYWRYDDYLGVGPGAHSRLTVRGEKLALARWKRPETWLDAANSTVGSVETKQSLTREERLIECLMMGLRLREGVRLARLEQESGRDFSAVIDPAQIEALSDLGLIGLDETRLFATPAGRQRLNAVLSALLDTGFDAATD